MPKGKAANSKKIDCILPRFERKLNASIRFNLNLFVYCLLVFYVKNSKMAVLNAFLWKDNLI